MTRIFRLEWFKKEVMGITISRSNIQKSTVKKTHKNKVKLTKVTKMDCNRTVGDKDFKQEEKGKTNVIKMEVKAELGQKLSDNHEQYTGAGADDSKSDTSEDVNGAIEIPSQVQIINSKDEELHKFSTHLSQNIDLEKNKCDDKYGASTETDKTHVCSVLKEDDEQSGVTHYSKNRSGEVVSNSQKAALHQSVCDNSIEVGRNLSLSEKRTNCDIKPGDVSVRSGNVNFDGAMPIDVDLEDVKSADEMSADVMSGDGKLTSDEPGDKMSDDAKPGGIETGGFETGGNETGGVETGGNETGGIETGGNETGGIETDGDETGGIETGGNETGGNETGGNETGGIETGGNESGGVESSGDETGGVETGGNESGGNETSGVETGGNETGGVETGGNETGGNETGGVETGGVETGGNEIGGVETGGNETGGVETGGVETGGNETGGDETGGVETGGNETGGVETGHVKACDDTSDQAVASSSIITGNDDNRQTDISTEKEREEKTATDRTVDDQRDENSEKQFDASESTEREEDSLNLRFYRNEIYSKPFPGEKIDGMLQWKGEYLLLERSHSYIQWLFPIPESRGMNYSAQALHEHEAKAIREDETLRARVLDAFKMMLDFYGMELADDKTGKVKRAHNWEERYEHLDRSFHNRFRITRILKALGELGFEHLQKPWLEFIMREATVNNVLPSLNGGCMEHWIDAIKDEEEHGHLYVLLFDLTEQLNNSKMQDNGFGIKDNENIAGNKEADSNSADQNESKDTEVQTTEKSNEDGDDVTRRNAEKADENLAEFTEGDSSGEIKDNVEETGADKNKNSYGESRHADEKKSTEESSEIEHSVTSTIEREERNAGEKDESHRSCGTTGYKGTEGTRENGQPVMII